jgi:hypothetical protein
LKNRRFTAVHGNFESSRRPVLAGVPQGSLLGPILFNIYMNDIPNVHNDNNAAMSLYADDTNVTVRSGSRKLAAGKLNSAIKMLEPWFEKWRITINVSKCSVILFSKRRVHLSTTHPIIKLHHTNMTLTNQVKYLRVTLDTKHTYK